MLCSAAAPRPFRAQPLQRFEARLCWCLGPQPPNPRPPPHPAPHNHKQPVAANAAPPATSALAERETFETASRDAYYTRRHELVLQHFPTALGVDDFISRVEIALSAHGFRGENSIGERLAVCVTCSGWVAVGGWRNGARACSCCCLGLFGRGAHTGGRGGGNGWRPFPGMPPHCPANPHRH